MLQHVQALLARNNFFGRCSSTGIKADQYVGLVPGSWSRDNKVVQV
jgi:hypothetical protein